MVPLLIYGMATWRMASMFVHELGPGDLFFRLRARVGITHDEARNIAIVPDGFFPGIFSCVWCCSVWVGMFWMIFDLFFPGAARRLARAFAFSALAIVIQRYMER